METDKRRKIREKIDEASRKEAFEATRTVLGQELATLSIQLRRATADEMSDIALQLDGIADVLRDKVRFGLME